MVSYGPLLETYTITLLHSLGQSKSQGPSRFKGQEIGLISLWEEWQRICKNVQSTALTGSNILFYWNISSHKVGAK